MLTALALLAMGVRALVPPGYMLAPSPERFITVTLCSAHGGAEVTIDRSTGAIVPDGQAPEKKSDAKDGGPCVFAATASLAPPAVGPEPSALHGAEFATSLAPTLATPGRGLAAPPPWATGPPQQA